MSVKMTPAEIEAYRQQTDRFFYGIVNSIADVTGSSTDANGRRVAYVMDNAPLVEALIMALSYALGSSGLCATADDIPRTAQNVGTSVAMYLKENLSRWQMNRVHQPDVPVSAVN